MTQPTRARKIWAILAATSAIAIGGIALAQTAPEDATQGVGMLVLATIVGGAVAWLRQTPLGKRVDGPVAVPALAVAVGAVTGSALEVVHLLDWQPFHDLIGRWPGAAAAGAVAGVEAVTGVSLVQYIGRITRRDDSGRLQLDTGALAGLVAGGAPSGAAATTAVSFVIDAARAVLAREPSGVPGALAALYPLIAGYAQRPEILTDDLRARIQAQVLDALRKAGLAGVDLGQDPEAPA